MKILACLPVLLLFISCNQQPNTSSESIKDTVRKAIESTTDSISAQLNTPEDIQKEFAATISAISKRDMDSVFFKYDCKGEKRGTVTAFTEKGEVRMLRHSYSEYDHYEATDQYFVKDSALFFVYAKALNWSFDSDSPEEGGTKDNITEKRTYIVEEHAVKCLEKKYTHKSYAKNNPEPNTVPNKEVVCSSAEVLQKDYKKLLKFVSDRGKGCPAD